MPRINIGGTLHDFSLVGTHAHPLFGDCFIVFINGACASAATFLFPPFSRMPRVNLFSKIHDENQ